MKIVYLLIVAVVFLSGCTQKIYDVIEPHPSTTEYQVIEEPVKISNQTANKTRWGSTTLFVFVDDASSVSVKGFKSGLVQDFIEASKQLSESVNKKIIFNFVNSRKDADIEVKWVENLPTDAIDAIGHTELKFSIGPLYNVINNARIQLLATKDSRPIKGHESVLLALHELGHAIGLDHTARKDSIMFPKLQDDVKGVSPEDIQTILALYKTESLPDLKIEDVAVTKRIVDKVLAKYYLADVNFSVANHGLIGSGPFSFSIRVGDRLIKSNSTELAQSLEGASISPGGTFTISYANISSSRDFFNITMKIDEENSILELNETNNFKTVKIS